jgi:hypothetical protein
VLHTRRRQSIYSQLIDDATYLLIRQDSPRLRLKRPGQPSITRRHAKLRSQPTKDTSRGRFLVSPRVKPNNGKAEPSAFVADAMSSRRCRTFEPSLSSAWCERSAANPPPARRFGLSALLPRDGRNLSNREMPAWKRLSGHAFHTIVWSRVPHDGPGGPPRPNRSKITGTAPTWAATSRWRVAQPIKPPIPACVYPVASRTQIGALICTFRPAPGSERSGQGRFPSRQPGRSRACRSVGY